MRNRILLASCIAAMAVCGLEVRADWNQWRGPNRDGVATSSPKLIRTLPEGGLRPAWISEPIPSARAGGWSSPVVAGGRVYVFAHMRTKKSSVGEIPKRKFPWLPPDKRGHLNDEQYREYEKKRRQEDLAIGTRNYDFTESVYCLDARTGKEVWKAEQPSVYSRFLQSGSPLVQDGKLIILGAGRIARCLDAATGKVIWETRLPGEFLDEYMMSSFAVSDGVAVVLGGQLFGIDAASGDVLWEGDAKRTRGTHSSPIVWKTGGRELVIVNVAGNDTACIEPKTGSELWRLRSEANLSTPVIAGDRLITFGNSRKKGLRCYELALERPKHLWTNNGLADKGGSPLVVGEKVYVQGEKRLACIDLTTGAKDWTTILRLRNPQYTSLIAADGLVIYAHDGVLCFETDSARYRPAIVAKIDRNGLMATEETFRRLLGHDKLPDTPENRRKRVTQYEQRVGRHGPLPCATPAISDGRLYIRLKNAIACYDVSSKEPVASR